MRRRATLFCTLVSIRRTMVKYPRMNTVGKTLKANAASALGDELANPIATRPLDRADQ